MRKIFLSLIYDKKIYLRKRDIKIARKFINNFRKTKYFSQKNIQSRF